MSTMQNDSPDRSLVPYPQKNCIDNLIDLPDDFWRVINAFGRRDYSENSKIAIGHDIQHFLRWFNSHNGELFTFHRVTEGDISSYKAYCQKASLANTTINRRLTTLRVFFEVAIEEGVYKGSNPTAKVRKLERTKLAPKALSKNDLGRLIRALELRAGARNDYRDVAVVALMAYAGLRVSEVANLNVTDVQLRVRSGILTVKHSKAGRTREVPLKERCREVLQKYLETTPPAPQGKLFSGQRDTTFTAQGIRRMLNRYARFLPDLRLTPHVLRHTFCSLYLKDNPGDIVSLAQTVGHASIVTTQIYLQNSMEDLQEKVERMI